MNNLPLSQLLGTLYDWKGERLFTVIETPEFTVNTLGNLDHTETDGNQIFVKVDNDTTVSIFIEDITNLAINSDSIIIQSHNKIISIEKCITATCFDHGVIFQNLI